MGSDEERPALVWRSVPLRIALLVMPGWLTVAVIIFSIPLSIKLVVGAVLFVSVIAPSTGLLAVAAMVPLGQFIGEFAGLETFRVSEACVVAFLAGWLLRAQDDRRGPTVPATVGWLLACSIAGSIGGLASQLGRYPGEFARTADTVFHAYYFTDLVGDRIGLVDGARLLEGLALMVATVTLFRQRPRLAERLPAALALSASIAGAASVLVWLGVSPPAFLARYARIGYRVSAHVADVNAAGSYFAMVLCLAAGMALRPNERRRLLWAVASIASAAGLWLSRSRTAIAAAGISLLVAATWYALRQMKPVVRATALGLAVVLALAVMAFRVHQFNFGVAYREQFYATSARMIEARPLFGIGVGQYYGTSPMFLSPQLAWNYGAENAHNNFLQIGAELGLVGFTLFIAWIGIALVRTASAVAIEPRDVRLLALATGTVAFIVTWVGSHPLLVGEVAAPFWIQCGLMVALAGSVQLNRTAVLLTPAGLRKPAAWRLPTAVAVAVSICLMAATIRAAANPIRLSASADVDGFYPWETGADGEPYRWSRQFASVFVPADTRRVQIPVRVPAELRLTHPLEVDVMVGGVLQSRTTVPGSWTTIEVELSTVMPPSRLQRIDLRTDRAWQPALYIPGDHDLRQVGIQVGKSHLVRVD